jgi:hypothetical protein
LKTYWTKCAEIGKTTDVKQLSANYIEREFKRKSNVHEEAWVDVGEKETCKPEPQFLV